MLYSIDSGHVFTLKSPNVPTIRGRLRGSCGSLGRALGWIPSSYLQLSTPSPDLSPHRDAEGIGGSVFWRTGGMGYMDRGPTTQKSCHQRQRASMCSLSLGVFTFLTRNLWDTSAATGAPHGVTFRAVAPRQQEPWWGRNPWRSADTAAQYSVPLCQEQLPDVNPIWYRVLTVVTHCVSTSYQVSSKPEGDSEKEQPGASSQKLLDSDQTF